MRSVVRFASVSLVLALFLYVAALAYLYFNQRAMIFVASKVVETPQSLDLPEARALRITTSDNEVLQALEIPPAPGKPLILYFQGQAGGFRDRAKRFQILASGGNGLLAIAYRGYGGSTGTPSEAGLGLDAEAAYAHAIADGFPPRRLVVLGEWLGTGVAVGLAARHEIGALVLDSPYSSLVDVAASRYPIFPVRSLILDPFRSDLEIGKTRAPILIVHGDADEIIPIGFAERLYALAPEPKTFIRVPGAGHLALGKRLPETLQWIAANVKP